MGDGSKINIWKDAWIPYLPLSRLSSPNTMIPSIQSVADIIDPRNGTWKLEALAHHISLEELKAIKKISLSLNLKDDHLIWKWDKRGIFSVKSAYAVLVVGQDCRLYEDHSPI